MSITGLLAILVLGAVSAEASDLTFYVSSSTGNDGNPGTISKPFLTIERARDVIRELKMRGGLGKTAVTVNLRAGTYFLTKTFTLSEQDSGIADAPITYTAYQREEVRLSGGIKLPVETLQPVDQGRERKRLAPLAIAHILQADLKVRGLASSQGTGWDRSQPGQSERASPEELFIDDEAMQLARWPNQEWAVVESVTDAGKPGPTDGRPGVFLFDNPRIVQWQDADVWLKGFWFWDWYDETLAVRTIDFVGHQIALAKPLVYGLKAGARYFAFNILSELDQEGEYYIDRGSASLYVWPPTPLQKNRITLSRLSTPIMELQNVSYVIIQGLIIEEGRDDGIQIVGGQGNEIKNCLIRNIGKDGVVIQGGRQHAITDSHVHHVGTRGIAATGGDRKALKPANHRILRNHIHHYGRRIAATKAGIDIDGVGIHVMRNDIHDAPHVGILFAGNDHIIELNEIHRVCLETSDAGAIYTGRDWTARGNVVRHNYLHDLYGPSAKGDVTAIYLDDLASGIEVFGNVISDVHRAILVGGGRDNTVINNALVNCDIGVSLDARGMTSVPSITSENSVLKKRLSAMPYRIPPWSTRYPQLATILHDEPTIPKNNVLRRNIAYRCAQSTMNPIARLYGSIEIPLASDGDLSLASRSGHHPPHEPRTPILTTIPGWEAVPFQEMGLPK